ncbi:hypothetical protein Tco_1575332 [Tanacetum coccineum]
MPTYRTTVVDALHNDEELRLNLDLLEERRDFVYRSNDASHAVDGGKLGPKWEGPYEVTKALEDGAYMLRSMDRTVLPRTWNIVNLKKCCTIPIPNYKKVAKKWVVVSLEVVHLLRQPPQSVWRHPPTESPSPRERWKARI